MIEHTWRSHRAPATLLLVLVLAITTAWTPAGASMGTNARFADLVTAPANGMAIPHGVATARQQALARALLATTLAATRSAEAALDSGARSLFQDRMTVARAAAPTPAKAEAPAAKAKAKASVAKTTTSGDAGRNHFWLPALGISKSVHLFPCSRTRPPDNYLYRWGCAGRNNVYIMGHASSVLRRLHDAYLGGRLHVGMRAVYADSKGRVHTYRVTTWRVVNPTNSAWAIASQRVPSMTIQTCIGLKRLNVRLVAVD